eukprot:358180-Chlamydomonas_euryale.AAC.2
MLWKHPVGSHLCHDAEVEERAVGVGTHFVKAERGRGTRRHPQRVRKLVVHVDDARALYLRAESHARTHACMHTRRGRECGGGHAADAPTQMHMSAERALCPNCDLLGAQLLRPEGSKLADLQDTLLGREPHAPRFPLPHPLVAPASQTAAYATCVGLAPHTTTHEQAGHLTQKRNAKMRYSTM